MRFTKASALTLQKINIAKNLKTTGKSTIQLSLFAGIPGRPKANGPFIERKTTVSSLFKVISTNTQHRTGTGFI
jgi:hypothetical protein